MPRHPVEHCNHQMRCGTHDDLAFPSVRSPRAIGRAVGRRDETVPETERGTVKRIGGDRGDDRCDVRDPSFASPRPATRKPGAYGRYDRQDRRPVVVRDQPPGGRTGSEPAGNGRVGCAVDTACGAVRPSETLGLTVRQ